MKYKVGNKVRIKTSKKYINGKETPVDIEKELEKNNYILTIKKVEETYYRMKEIPQYIWDESVIEELISPPIIISLFPTNKRFELMDLD